MNTVMVTSTAWMVLKVFQGFSRCPDSTDRPLVTQQEADSMFSHIAIILQNYTDLPHHAPSTEKTPKSFL